MQPVCSGTSVKALILTGRAVVESLSCGERRGTAATADRKCKSVVT